MALVSLSCCFSPFKSSVMELGGAVVLDGCAVGTGVFATGGAAFLFGACGAGVVTVGFDSAARAGGDVADGADVMACSGAGCGAGVVTVGFDSAARAGGDVADGAD